MNRNPYATPRRTPRRSNPLRRVNRRPTRLQRSRLNRTIRNLRSLYNRGQAVIDGIRTVGGDPVAGARTLQRVRNTSVSNRPNQARLILRHSTGRPSRNRVRFNINTTPLPYRGIGAKYAGQFKTAVPAAQIDSAILPYLAAGYSCKREVHGRVEDPDCVYLWCSTYYKPQLAETIACAIYRKLLLKMGVTIQTPSDVPPLQDANLNSNDQPLAGGHYLKWVRISENGDRTQTRIFINDNESFRDFAVNSFAPQLITEGFNQSGTRQFEKIGIYLEIGGVAPDRIRAELNLKEEKLDLMNAITLTLQNRTASATGVTNTDTNDTQPLKGVMYCHNKAVPQAISTNVGEALQTVLTNTEAMNLIRGLQLDVNLREPPTPKFFTTCKKASNVKLQPGELKRYTLVHRMTGYFNDLVCKKLRVAQGTFGYGIGVPGQALMFAFEEVMNTGSAFRITVAYEMERRMACISRTRKRRVMLEGWSERAASINNVPS